MSKSSSRERVDVDIDDGEKWSTSELQERESSGQQLAAERRLVRRIDLRLLPLAMFIYSLNFLDRINIGNAKVLNSATEDSLMQRLHITDTQYLTGLMIFYIAYFIFEVPSNYGMKKFRPSRWLALLMLGWGVMTMLLSKVNDYAGLIVVRFLLGAFEAGLFPGLIYCLTFWYKQDERGVRAALIASSAPLGGAFGGSIAFGVGHMNGIRGLEAWRWLFLIEGAPSCACALLVWLFFPDFPEIDKWLSDEDRDLAINRIKGVSSLGHAKITWAQTKETLMDWRLYLHYNLFICISVPFSSVSLFSPTIITGLGYTGLQAQLFSVPPYASAFVLSVIVAWLADRYAKRSWAAFSCLVLGGICFLIQGALPAHAPRARYGLLCAAVSFHFSSIPPMLSWLTANLKHTGASTLAVGLNGAVGQIGQIIGVYIFKSSEAPRFPTGFFTNGAFLIEGAVAVAILHCIYVRRNKQLNNGEKKWQL